LLPKTHRLVSRGDFKGVFDARHTARSGPLTLLYSRTDRKYIRFGFVVSGAVSKNAVVRNRLRRQLHEIIRFYLPSLSGGYDCVLRTYPDIVGISYKDMKKHIEIILKKSAIMNDRSKHSKLEID